MLRPTAPVPRVVQRPERRAQDWSRKAVRWASPARATEPPALEPLAEVQALAMEQLAPGSREWPGALERSRREERQKPRRQESPRERNGSDRMTWRLSPLARGGSDQRWQSRAISAS